MNIKICYETIIKSEIRLYEGLQCVVGLFRGPDSASLAIIHFLWDSGAESTSPPI